MRWSPGFPRRPRRYCESKVFFFEKKKQKTFIRLAAALPDKRKGRNNKNPPRLAISGETAAESIKSFCFFFSKKKALLSQNRLHPIALVIGMALD